MGSINLKHTGSGSAIALSSDGTSLLLDGTAIGGGGADLYAANESSPSAQPSATGTNAIAIGDSAVASGTRSTALGYLSNASASGSVALGMGRSSGGASFSAVIDNEFSGGALNAGSIAIGNTARANASYATAIGRNTISTALYSIAIGYNSTASHNYSIALGENITSTAAYQINIGGTTQDVRISETYTLPKVDGTASGQVLTTDGSGVVSWATAGGGADLYAANESSPSAQPSATGANSVAIGDSAVASGADSFAIGDNADATSAGAIAIGTSAQSTYFNTIAIGESSSASGNRSIALGRTASASADLSTAIGLNSSTQGSVTATGAGAMALGGSRAVGVDSFAAAIANNTSSYGALRANNIAMGQNAKADSSTGGGVAIGSNTIANSRETVAIGSAAYADGSGSVALGGYFGTSIQARATGNASFAVAGYNGFGSIDSTAAGLGSIAMGGGHADQDQSKAFGAYAHSNVRGKVAWSAYSLQGQHGTTQAGNYVLINATTNATGTVLVTDYQLTSPSAINQVVLPNNSCYGFTGTVIAREAASATNDFAVWEIKGGAVRAGSASTTALGTYNINKISESTGATNWSIALSADTTYGAVAITVTGEASHNIRWVATVNTAEVIY